MTAESIGTAENRIRDASISGALTAGRLYAGGTTGGTGSITVTQGADITGTLTAGSITLAEGSDSVFEGKVTAESLTVAGKAESSGKLTAKESEISGSLKANDAVLGDSLITGGVSAEAQRCRSDFRKRQRERGERAFPQRKFQHPPRRLAPGGNC